MARYCVPLRANVHMRERSHSASIRREDWLGKVSNRVPATVYVGARAESKPSSESAGSVQRLFSATVRFGSQSLLREVKPEAPELQRR